MDTNRRMKISELERLSGIPRSTIHYYVREGLLHPPEKIGRTMAYYDENHLTFLQAMRKAKTDYQKSKATLLLPRSIPKGDRQDSKIQSDGGREASFGEEASISAKQRRKQEIIDAAVQLFSKKGYHHTSVRDITQMVGVSKATFYLYYTGKQELFVEVVDDVIKNILGKSANAIRKEEHPTENLLIRGRVFGENYSKYNEILTQLRAGMTTEHEWARKQVKKTYRDLAKPLIRTAEEAMERKLIREVNPELLAFAEIGIIDIMALRTTLDERYTFNEVVEFVSDLLLNGLRLTSSSL